VSKPPFVSNESTGVIKQSLVKNLTNYTTQEISPLDISTVHLCRTNFWKDYLQLDFHSQLYIQKSGGSQILSR